MARKNIDVGPFAEARLRLGDFGLNLFSACLIQESIEKLYDAEQAYIMAVANQNIDEIDKTKMEYEAMQTSFMIATQFASQDETTQ